MFQKQFLIILTCINPYSSGTNMYAFLMHLMSKLFGRTAKKNMEKNKKE